jgi:repressor LexA
MVAMSDTPNTAKPAGDLPWGLRIRQLRIAAGLTQEQLADKMDTTKATVSKIERSTGLPKGIWLVKLARALGVDFGSLSPDAQPHLQRADQIPVIGMIAAGNWREAIQSPDGYITAINPKPHMFALQIHGDSMDQIAPEGAFVSIDPTSPTLSEGSLYAVQNGDGEATIKRFRRSPDRLEPMSSNPVHQPIILGSEPITIIGRATSVVQML